MKQYFKQNQRYSGTKCGDTAGRFQDSVLESKAMKSSPYNDEKNDGRGSGATKATRPMNDPTVIFPD
jgi:hypothetical protein